MKTHSYRSYDLMELNAHELSIIRDALRAYEKEAKRGALYFGDFRMVLHMVENLLEP